MIRSSGDGALAETAASGLTPDRLSRSPAVARIHSLGTRSTSPTDSWETMKSGLLMSPMGSP